jgi:hypothetical protein
LILNIVAVIISNIEQIEQVNSSRLMIDIISIWGGFGLLIIANYLQNPDRYHFIDNADL